MALATEPTFDRRRLVAVAHPRLPRPVTQALIVHGAEVVRAGVATFLTGAASYDVAQAATVFEAFRLAAAHHPQLVLFDFAPGEGAEACRLFGGLWPRPRLVALVARGGAVSARECLEAGADAAVAIHTVSREHFLLAVQRAIDGTGPVAAGFPAETEAATDGAIDAGPLSALTRREREMLYLIGEGLSNREIADALGLSVKTVEAHRANVGRKLNVRSRAGLMRLAMAGSLA